MGKTKRSKKPGLVRSKYPITDRAVCDVIDALWKLLQVSPGEDLCPLWDEYDKIQTCLKRLRDLQGPPSSAASSRTLGLPKFEKWLQDHGAMYDDLEIVETIGMDLGLRTKREIQQDEKVVIIPEKLMMSSETAMKGVLGAVISQDQMLQAMPNVSLALHLLNEKYSLDSFWKPYIDILPPSFSLPLYFSKQELQMLKGSPCVAKSLSQIRNITKLYAHLHRIIRVTGKESLDLFKSGFLYDDFVWAVSCVMSRQNEIPSKSGLPSPTLALIPLWDLCNHMSGHISTFFNVDSQTCDCYAHCYFKAKEEFRIFYGPRTNSELLLQQGFVYLQNEFDSLQIKLGISSGEDDKTKAMKIQLLKSLNVSVSGTFFLLQPKVDPFTSDLRVFIRIFTAPQEKLEDLIEGSLALAKSKLFDTKWHFEDMKALEFIEKRCSLLMRAYTTTVSEDEVLLSTDSSLSACATQAILLRMCEKKILMDTSHYARCVVEELNTKPID